VVQVEFLEYPLNKIKNKHAQKQGKLKPTLKFFASLRAIFKNKIDQVLF
jgi:hypothetical protein